MRNWLRALLFTSAFSPALLSLAYVRYDTFGWCTDVLQLIVIGLIGTLLPLAIMRLVAKHGEVISIQVKKLESNDVLLIGFMASYVFPLAAKGVEMTISGIVWSLFGIFVMMWLCTSVPAHPLLRIFRFRFYKLESSTGVVYTFIARREIHDPREIKAVKKISRTMLVEAEDA